ncbi:MAG: NUDIX domain-containing protein [Verrucomicrobiae bacterium]|nr:NUDIX domain-containing protein [Verrucomicrobiae bacterium]
MPNELLDVVDPNDEVVGQALRNEVHFQCLRHRAVHVLVFNRRGEIFLQKRSSRKDQHPNLWDSSASGHVDAGEKYDHAAERELLEEIGLAVTTPPVRLFKLPASNATEQEFVWVYRCEAEGPFRLNPEEISEGRWLAPEEVDWWLQHQPGKFAPVFPLIWREWRRRQSPPPSA